MNTLNKIAYDLVGSTGKADDQALLERMKFNIQAYRSTFFRNDQSRGNRIPIAFVQSLGCMEVVKTSSSECCDLDFECTVLKTKNRIPKPIRLKSGDAFSYVGLVDGSQSFSQSTRVAAQYNSFSRFSGRLPFYVYENEHIYVFNVNVKSILIKGVFEDPMELANISDCEGKKCFDPNEIYPIPADMIPLISKAIRVDVLGVQQVKDDAKVEIDVGKA